MEVDTLAGNRLGEEHVLARGGAVLEEPVRGEMDRPLPRRALPVELPGHRRAAGSLTRGP